jgi:hypothetical protein
VDYGGARKEEKRREEMWAGAYAVNVSSESLSIDPCLRVNSKRDRDENRT